MYTGVKFHEMYVRGSIKLSNCETFHPPISGGVGEIEFPLHRIGGLVREPIFFRTRRIRRVSKDFDFSRRNSSSGPTVFNLKTFIGAQITTRGSVHGNYLLPLRGAMGIDLSFRRRK